MSTSQPAQAPVAAGGAFECFNVKIENHIAHIRLARPQVANAMNMTFWNELPAIVKDISDNARARVIVISGEGKHFTAGMDLAVFGGGADQSHIEAGRRRERLMQTVLMLQKTFSCLEEARMPVLAAIQGACVGGGMDFVSAADMRYCTKEAFFSIAEINIGMTADVGTFPRMGYVMPQGLVREMAFTGRRMMAEEAKACGFVNEVFDTHEAMMQAVTGHAKEIASKSPLAIWGSKEMLNYGRDHSVADALKHIAVWQTGMFQPGDMAESFTAQQEKRAPEFQELMPVPKRFDNL